MQLDLKMSILPQEKRGGRESFHVMQQGSELAVIPPMYCSSVCTLPFLTKNHNATLPIHFDSSPASAAFRTATVQPEMRGMPELY